MNTIPLLLLVHTHAHAAALMSCIPHIKAHYGWCWVVYSPAVLADPALLEREFDQQIADLSRAAKECYAREDGAGGDQYKAKRDAAILEKTAKVKDAWKALSKEEQNEAENKIFKEFWTQLRDDGKLPVTISRHSDHFETAAHVEMQNALKAGMKPMFVPGGYVIAWPTSLPKEADINVVLRSPDGGVYNPDSDPNFRRDHTPTPPTPTPPPVPAIKIDKRTKEYKARLKELQGMSLDDLGPIAFELGIKPTDPLAGKRDDLITRILELEHSADVSAY